MEPPARVKAPLKRPPGTKKPVVKIEPGTLGPTFGPLARRATSDRLPTPSARSGRNPRSTAHELLSHISTSLDPSTQLSRSEDRFACTLQTTQLFTLSNQLRDSRTTIENLRNRLQEANRERHAAERRADRAEFVNMLLETRGR